MRRRGSQAGEGQLGCIIWAVVLGIVILIGWKAVPVKIKSAELYDFMEDQARYTKKKQEDRTMSAILNKADELGLPLLEEDLTVTRRKDYVDINYYYEVDLEFPGYTYTWVFEGNIHRPVFVY